MRIFTFITALAVYAFLSLAQVNAQTCEKIYVPKEAIELSDTGIALLIGDDDPLPIDALYSDENGLYVSGIYFIEKYGYCRRCDIVHPGGECPEVKN